MQHKKRTSFFDFQLSIIKRELSFNNKKENVKETNNSRENKNIDTKIEKINETKLVLNENENQELLLHRDIVDDIKKELTKKDESKKTSNKKEGRVIAKL